jgi:SAM-dependent methyltransferase
MASLLLGCGRNHTKRLHLEGKPEWSEPLTKVDINPNCGADILYDLSLTQHGIRLPFEDNSFDEIGAFDVLEHWGAQGDWKAYFKEFAEYWRILKPNGVMYIIVPIGESAFTDPGHTRFFSECHFWFLDQKWYDHAHEVGTPATDYRWFWKHDFEPLLIIKQGPALGVALRKRVADASQN